MFKKYTKISSLLSLVGIVILGLNACGGSSGGGQSTPKCKRA